MKKQYTKKRAVEATKYWESVLKRIDESKKAALLAITELFSNIDEECLKAQLTQQIQNMPCEKYAKSCNKVEAIFAIDDKLVADFTTDNLRQMCVPCSIVEKNGKPQVILSKKAYEADLSTGLKSFTAKYKNNSIDVVGRYHKDIAERMQFIWKRPEKKKRKPKKYTLENFKLEPLARKYFSYGAIQQRMLKDIVDWLNRGGDPFGAGNSPDLVFHGLENADVGVLSLYKNDPHHVSTNDVDRVVEALTQHYGQICNKPLYRGVSKAELDGIMEKINSKKTVFIRDKTTSFTTDYAHAEKFAQYGGGSIVDVGKDRKAGAVLTVYCKKPLMFIDEWIFYYNMANHIAGIDPDMTQPQALEETLLEHEWLLPKNYKWKLVDKGKLVFEIA